MADVTLRSLVAAHPHQFAAQTWYLTEAFVDRRLGASLEVPLKSKPFREEPAQSTCPSAVALADLYLRHPNLELWRGFVWCKDSDQWGQRIFVGGLEMRRGFSGGGFQIHRHITVTDDWRLPVW